MLDEEIERFNSVLRKIFNVYSLTFFSSSLPLKHSYWDPSADNCQVSVNDHVTFTCRRLVKVDKYQLQDN